MSFEQLRLAIQGLASVQSARVHLALPNQNGFFREQQKPSASVLLTLHPGRTLERNQIAGIVHLVASSVPELAPSAVSVVDDSGKLRHGSLKVGAVGPYHVTEMIEAYHAVHPRIKISVTLGNSEVVLDALDRASPSQGLFLREIQQRDSGGREPREFAIDPSGQFMIIANQKSDGLVVLARDPDSGKLGDTVQTLPMGRPSDVKFIDRTEP